MKINQSKVIPMMIIAFVIIVFFVISCKKSPQMQMNSEWDSLVSNKKVSTILEPGKGFISELKITFNNDTKIELPTTVVLRMPIESYETGVPQIVWIDYDVPINETNDGFIVFNSNGVITEGASLHFQHPLKFNSIEQGEVPDNLDLDDTEGLVNPKHIWQYPNAEHTEFMFKERFSTIRFDEGQSPDLFVDNTTFHTIDEAKTKLGSFLKPWGADDATVNTLKAKFDEPDFQALNAGNVTLMMAALINEVKHPGHIEILKAKEQTIGNNEHSSASVQYANGTGTITYGKYAPFEDPDLLALLQRTEMMETGGNSPSRQEQFIQKIVMLREYSDILKLRPDIASQKSGLLRTLHTEAGILLHSGDNTFYTIGLPSLLGKNANPITSYNSYSGYIDTIYDNSPPNENAEIPSEMSTDLINYFGLNPNITYTNQLINELDTTIRSEWDLTPLACAIGLKTY